MAKRGLRFRIYPTKQQIALIVKTFGCCRLVRNKALVLRNDAYQHGDKANYSMTSAMLTSFKHSEEFAFLNEVDSIALQQALRDLDRAFVNFFKKLAARPQYVSKHSNFKSYRTINQNDNIRIVNKYIKLPKLGYVKIRKTMPVTNINNVTIEMTPTGKFYAVVNVDFEPEVRTNDGNIIGIDVGIKEFYTDSNGNTVNNPRHLEKMERKLIRAQRKLSRKKAGSNNRNKQRKQVALIHEKITNQRNDFLQKLSTTLISENQVIYVEDLKVKNMMHNHKLAKYIASVSWSKFYDMLEYKAVWYGNEIIKVPTFYPSSQTCSICGHKNTKVKNLRVRAWKCPICHTQHNRDHNAAINILSKGMQMQSA